MNCKTLLRQGMFLAYMLDILWFFLDLTQSAFTCSKTTVETPEQCVKYAQN